MPQRVLDLLRLDFAPPHRQPSGGRLVLATLVSIAGSLLADALIVVIAQAIAPSAMGYAHFQFGDYAKLTIVGVIIACVAWPITTRITSQPRAMFLLMAIAVTLVLWLPDVYILVKGQPAKAVAALFLMHLAIALVTYNALVRLAPIRAQRQASTHRARQVGR
jgi:bacteriorhodopsin